VLQSTSLDLQLTVKEALGVYAGLFPHPRPVGEVLELIDLADEAGTRIGQRRGWTSAWASSAARSCWPWPRERSRCWSGWSPTTPAWAPGRLRAWS
jgi:hypothetical protein